MEEEEREGKGRRKGRKGRNKCSAAAAARRLLNNPPVWLAAGGGAIGERLADWPVAAAGAHADAEKQEGRERTREGRGLTPREGKGRWEGVRQAGSTRWRERERMGADEGSLNQCDGDERGARNRICGRRCKIRPYLSTKGIHIR